MFAVLACFQYCDPSLYTLALQQVLVKLVYCANYSFKLRSWRLQIVGITSDCLDADASDKDVQQKSSAALRQELEWGIHLGLQACILPVPPRLDNANFAHVINQVCDACYTVTLHTISAGSLLIAHGRPALDIASSFKVSKSAGLESPSLPQYQQ